MTDIPFNEQVETRAAPRFVTGPWSFRLFLARAPKGLSANDRAHWRTKAESTQAVRAMVMRKVREQRVPALERIRVNVEWVVRDRRRRDADNLAPFLKAIYDGIGADKGVSARIVEDDVPEFMEKVGATIRYDPGGTPHFLITITDIG